MDDQTNIKFMKQAEWSEHINKILEENEKTNDSLDLTMRLNRSNHKRLREEFEEFKDSTLIRLDLEIENRTNAFNKIAQLENEVEALQIWKYNIETKLERIEDILVVHRNQDRAQKKNYKALRDVWDKTVLKIIEKGKHGEQK